MHLRNFFPILFTYLFFKTKQRFLERLFMETNFRLRGMTKALNHYGNRTESKIALFVALKISGMPHVVYFRAKRFVSNL